MNISVFNQAVSKLNTHDPDIRPFLSIKQTVTLDMCTVAPDKLVNKNVVSNVSFRGFFRTILIFS